MSFLRQSSKCCRVRNNGNAGEIAAQKICVATTVSPGCLGLHRYIRRFVPPRFLEAVHWVAVRSPACSQAAPERQEQSSSLFPRPQAVIPEQFSYAGKATKEIYSHHRA